MLETLFVAPMLFRHRCTVYGQLPEVGYDSGDESDTPVLLRCRSGIGIG